jgi:DNA-directed RNA polymerase subunit L
MQEPTSMSNLNEVEFTSNPRVDIISDIRDNVLQFTLSNVNVSIANAIRRVILSDIPIVVFRVSPNDKNKCVITNNTCGLNNEIVKHRLSCIPIHIKDVSEFPLKNYIMELNVQNNTNTAIYVTTKDFVIKDKVTDKALPQDKIREIFPPNDLTGDFIDFVKLKPKPSDEIPGKQINLTCEFDIGTAKEDGAYNVVSACSYGNTIDEAVQEAELQKLKQKWKDAGKKDQEIEFEAANWKLLEGKRIFKKDSFNFIIETIGIYTNVELLTIACKLLIEKSENLNNIIDNDEMEIKTSDNTMKNSYDIILDNEDYTIGKVIEYYMLENYYQKKLITFCGFKMLHPHDTYGIIRIAFLEPQDISKIKGLLKQCLNNAIYTFQKINKEFLKLVER